VWNSSRRCPPTRVRTASAGSRRRRGGSTASSDGSVIRRRRSWRTPTRRGPSSSSSDMRRKLVSVLLVALALAAVVAATRARRLAARVDELAVDVGGSPASVPTAGDDEPAAPFRYGVISSARGDHAKVGAAID